ncbi:hypothetical protein MBH78_22965 [Oceanimonas sp. NS1]|nr:hypothetical protein [Oceanimonas sp. NS1]
MMLAGCAGPQERTLARLERIADAVMAAPCDALAMITGWWTTPMCQG